MTEPTAIELFNDALELESDQRREQFLDRACRDNEPLRRHVRALLAAHLGAGNFLGDDASPAETAAPGVGVSDGSIAVGRMIGPYKIREQIGEGGMGAVYVAEQTAPVKRKVALKLIRAGLASSDLVGRFEAERQALAMMNHPHIARVLDGGTTDSGQPYFAMELVQGLPITDYCDERKLSTDERLNLLLDVCGAVQHAHQRGIIHRDLKPSNILVGEIDDKAVVKVIDFGVAKAVNQKLTDQTVYTQFAQMVGTPLYMSPEQAGLGVLDIDTRSDVYSLGVLLYELLTGNTPFDSKTLQSAGYDEMRRMIREDEPRRPSALINTLNPASLSTTSEKRRSDPRRLAHDLRGELDWIAMKALEKDRARRYESASSLAADIMSCLDGESVEACPPSAAYRLKKFARRNRAAIATVSLVFVSLVVGAIGTGWQAWKATSNLVLADSERERAENNLQLAMSVIDETFFAPIGDDQIVNSHSDVAMFRVDAVLRATFLPTELSVEMSQQDQARIERGIGFYQQIASQNPTSTLARFESAKALRRLGLLQRRMGRNKEAQRSTRTAVDNLTGLTKQPTASAAYFLELGEAYYQLAQLSPRQELNNLLDRSVRVANQAIVLDPDNVRALRFRGKVYIARHSFAEAARDFETVVRLCPDNAEYCDDLGRLLYFMGEGDKALPFANRAVELMPHDNSRFGFRFHLAEIHRWILNDPESAASVWDQGVAFASGPSETLAVQTRASYLRRNHQRTVESANQWIALDQNCCEAHILRASAHLRLHQLERATDDLKKAQGLAQTDWDFIPIAEHYQALGLNTDALEALQNAFEINPLNPYIYERRGETLVRQEHFEEALREYDKCLELAPLMAFAYLRRASVQFHLKRYSKVVPDLASYVRMRPEQAGLALRFIPPEDVASCPNAEIKQDLISLAQTALEQSDTRSVRSALAKLKSLFSD